MAKERLTLYDKYGNVIEYDISAASITIDAEGKQLDVKLTELADAIAARIKSVTFNGSEKTPDQQGKISISQEQPNWNESNPQHPSYIQGKPQLANVATTGDYNDLRNLPVIPEGGPTIVPDTAMSDTSENVVQNKVIKAFVEALVTQSISNLVDGAPLALDTLKELADALGDNDNAISALTSAIASKISGIKANGASETLPVIDGIVELPPAGSTIFPATATPSMDGTANVGSSAKYAREDHVHPHDSTKLSKSDVSVETQGDGTFVIHVGETDYTINLNHTHEGMVVTDVRDINELPEPEDMDENTIYAGAEDGEISVVYIGGLPFYGGGGGTATPVLRRPSDGDSLAMGLPNNGVIESTINIKGKSLSQSLLVEITGTGFTFGATQPNGVTIDQQAETPTATIDAAVANSALGVNVVIAYTGNTMYAEGLLSVTGENGISADVSLMSVFTPTMSGIVGQWEGSDSPSGGSWIDRVNNMVFTLGGTADKTSEGYRFDNLLSQKAAYAMMNAASTTLLNQQIDKVFTCYVECLVKFSAEGKEARIIDFGELGASLSGISLSATIKQNGDIASAFKNNGNTTSGFAQKVSPASTGITFGLDTYVPLKIKLGVRLLQNGTQEIYAECGEGRCYAILNTPRTINFSGSNSGDAYPETRVAAVLGLGYTQYQFVDQLAPNSFADVIYKRILIFNTEV